MVTFGHFYMRLHRTAFMKGRDDRAASSVSLLHQTNDPNVFGWGVHPIVNLRGYAYPAASQSRENFAAPKLNHFQKYEQTNTNYQ